MKNSESYLPVYFETEDRTIILKVYYDYSPSEPIVMYDLHGEGYPGAAEDVNIYKTEGPAWFNVNDLSEQDIENIREECFENEHMYDDYFEE